MPRVMVELALRVEHLITGFNVQLGLVGGAVYVTESPVLEESVPPPERISQKY